MNKFEFNETNHIYKLNGSVIPSVSEGIESIHQKIYEDISFYTLETSADRGTRVHRVIGFWNKYDFYNVDDYCKGYVEAYTKFRNKHPSWKLLNSELRTDYAYIRGLPFAPTNEMNGQALVMHEGFGGFFSVPCKCKYSRFHFNNISSKFWRERALQWRTGDTWIGFSGCYIKA